EFRRVLFRSQLGGRPGLLERLARVEELDLLDHVGRDDRDLLPCELPLGHVVPPRSLSPRGTALAGGQTQEADRCRSSQSAASLNAFTSFARFVNPWPSSSNTTYSTGRPSSRSFATSWSDSPFTTLGSVAPCSTSSGVFAC